jgi:DNA-directed RNA polymerase specialized sigma24 family protein
LSTAGLAPTRSRDEIEAAIRGLRPPDWARLRKVARRYANTGAIEADDLLQEAMMRALSTRACPAHVDVVRFIAEAMRSIAHDQRKKQKPVAELVPIARTGEAFETGVDLVDESEGPEDGLITKQDAAHYVATYDAIRALFEDDPIAKDVLDGRLEGMTPDDIRALTGLDQRAYDTKFRLIRRRIEKAYPKGWKP